MKQQDVLRWRLASSWSSSMHRRIFLPKSRTTLWAMWLFTAIHPCHSPLCMCLTFEIWNAKICPWDMKYLKISIWDTKDQNMPIFYILFFISDIKIFEYFFLISVGGVFEIILVIEMTRDAIIVTVISSQIFPPL